MAFLIKHHTQFVTKDEYRKAMHVLADDLRMLQCAILPNVRKNLNFLLKNTKF